MFGVRGYSCDWDAADTAVVVSHIRCVAARQLGRDHDVDARSTQLLSFFAASGDVGFAADCANALVRGVRHSLM